MTKKVNIAAHLLLIIVFTVWSTSSLHAETSIKKFFVNLYGHILQINYNADFYSTREKLMTEAGMDEFLKSLWNDEETDSLLKQLDKQAAQFNMDDVAYLMMLNKVTDAVFKNEDASFKTLYKYGILKQKGFDVVLGYGEHSLTLYGTTDFNVENALFIQKGNHIYYDLSFNQNSIPETEREYVPQVTTTSGSKIFHLNTFTPPSFKAKHVKKSYPFEYDGYMYFLRCEMNQSLVEYYRDLPDICINSVYLNYGLSDQAKKTLVKSLRDATVNMNTEKAVDFLLKFTQYTFTYKKDVVEKFAFPEEVLANEVADCEDKSILFAYLSKEVLGIHSIALFYKNEEHINVAVENWKKDDHSKGSFTYNHHNYIVCEPSGNGLNPGESINNISYADIIPW
jgi:hypothetical protein